MAAIPAGRRLISQVGVEPKWLMSTSAARMGALRTAPLGARAVSKYEDCQGHKQQWGYVAILGVAAGMVALVCFYLCVWLVRHQSRQRTAVQLPLAPDLHNADEGDRSDEMKRAGPSGDGESAMQTWSSESVELVVMAGEHVPTFVAHPVVQCPAPLPTQGNIIH